MNAATVDGSVAWRHLFDGRDLRGWSIMSGGRPAAVEVRDGAIRGHMVRGTVEHTLIATDETFGDVILELDVRRDGPVNSGVLVRAVETTAQASVRLHGYQVKIDPSDSRRWTGGVFDDYGRSWRWLHTLVDDLRAQHAERPGEWNRIRIEAIADRIRVWVNEVPTTHLIDDRYRQGRIAFKIHSLADDAPPAAESDVIWFRDVRVIADDAERHIRRTPLPARAADAAQPIQLAQD